MRPKIPPPKAGSLSDFDDGLQFKFAIVRTNAGDEYTGQIIGVYNEAHFMWNPTPYSTLALFVCSDPTVKLGHFSVQPGSDPGIFSISSADISTITLVGQPDSLVEYQHFMRINGYVWSVTPVEGRSGSLETGQATTLGRMVEAIMPGILEPSTLT